MCGLSGVMSSTISWGEEGMFRDLLNVSSLRGYEGSGVIIAQRNHFHRPPLVRTLRTKEIAGKLAYSPELAELLKPRTSVAIGHARWPTRGGNDIKAIHPHRVGHIIGVHNGTMSRVAGVDVKDQSDSAMLFESIAKIGVVDTIKESTGAYALVWIDENERTVNFLRNSQRTLFFKNTGWQKNINTLYWASEQEMLDFVFKRSYRGENTWNTYLPVDTWFKYPLEVEHIIRPAEVTPDVKPKSVSAPYQHGRYRSGVYDFGEAFGEVDPWEDADQTLVANRIEDWRSPGRSNLPNNVLMLPAPEVTPKSGKPLSKHEQKRRAKALAKEAADEAKRQERFRNKANAGVIIGEEHPSWLADMEKLDTKPVSGVLPVAGQGCCWCSGTAFIDEHVYPLDASFMGGKQDFICSDCGSLPECKGFIENTPKVLVTSSGDEQ